MNLNKIILVELFVLNVYNTSVILSVDCGTNFKISLNLCNSFYFALCYIYTFFIDQKVFFWSMIFLDVRIFFELLGSVQINAIYRLFR